MTMAFDVETVRVDRCGRLAMRPANSQTMLGAVDGAQLAVIPDVAGDYAVELMVFDGELWSALPATFAFQARAP